MSAETQVPPVARDARGLRICHELAHCRADWWWFLLLGIALVILGTVAIGSAVAVTLATAVIFGVVLLAAGIVVLVSSFWTGQWSGFLVHVLLGVLYGVVGMFMIHSPAEAAVALTLLIAAYLVAIGAFRLVAALAIRFPGWGWHLLAGVVSVLLGMLIYRQWPASGLMIIGLFVGIELIFSGWTWVMLALEVRQAEAHDEAPQPPAAA